MLDQLRQVAIFAKTIDHGSFRGAARELRLSPSVVSHHISQLEEYLGVALVYRSTRKLALTSEGEQLLAATHPLLEAVEDVFSQISSTASNPTGQLRLTTPSVLIQSHLTELLAAFSKKHPGIKLILDYSDSRQDLISEGHDIAIRMGSKIKGSLKTRSLFQVSRRLVASRSYLENLPKPRTPRDLHDWKWIQLTPVQHIKPTFTKPRAKPISIKVDAHIMANSVVAMCQLATLGAGLAIVPEFLAESSVATGQLEYVLPEWGIEPIDVYAAWPSNAPRHGLIKLLLTEISAEHTLG